MAAPIVTIRAVGPALELVHVLQSCEHSAFPVADAHGRYCGTMMRSWLVLLLERHGKVRMPRPPNHCSRAPSSRLDFPTDALTAVCSITAQAEEQMRSAHGRSGERGGSDGDGAAGGVASKSSQTRTQVDLEQVQPPLLLPDDFRWQEVHQPRCEALPTGRRPLRLSDDAVGAISANTVLVLQPYIDTGAVTVTQVQPSKQTEPKASSPLPTQPCPPCRPPLMRGATCCSIDVRQACPMTQCFELFRTLGLRHLPVLSNDHQAVGIITRQELTTNFAAHAGLHRTTETSASTSHAPE
jgi:hypothetical protein